VALITLASLFDRFDNCRICKKSGSSLQHILGGGLTTHPKTALVFINPTRQNVSCDPKWNGPRFPFIGVTRFWKILADSGLISKDFVLSGWDEGKARGLLSKLRRKKIYITNLVKCTQNHGNYPEKKVFDYHLPLFFKEMDIIRPRAIIAFGALTTKYLTGRNIKMGEYFKRPEPLNYRNMKEIRVYPCYFPVGRGSPKLATEVLRKLSFLLE